MPPNIACLTSCCSAPTCDIGSDPFGTDGSGVPSGWTLRTGAFDVVSGFLDSTTSDSLALFSTAHPDAIASAIITVEVYFGGDDKGTIVFNHSGSSDAAYHFVQVTPTTLSLWSRSGSVDTMLKCVACDLSGSPSTVTAYFDGQTTGTFAAVCGSRYVYHNVGTGHTGTYVGLGTKTVVSEMAFDNFDFNKYEQSGNGCLSYTPDDCDLTSDDFSLSDNTDLECPWIDITGSSERLSGKLKMTASNSRVKCQVSNPNTGEMTVVVDVVGSASDNVIEIGLGANSAATTYFYMRLTTGTTKPFKVGSTAGGDLSSVNVTTTAGTTYSIIVALANGRICATITDDSLVSQTVSGAVTVPSTESWATLGCRTLASGNVTFDNFVLRKGYTVTDDPTCGRCGAVGPNCGTDCCGEAHTQMIVDIGSGLTDKATCSWCSQLDGEFTAIFDSGCDWVYCQHPMDSLPDPCDCADYTCDSDCADGGFDESGPSTENCRSADSGAAANECNGVSILVQIRVDDDNRCYLWAWVSIINQPEESVTSPCAWPTRGQVMAEACYATTLGEDVAPCSGDTYTLNLYSGSLLCDSSYRNGNFFPPITYGCNGSFPSTITVRSAP